MTAVELLREVKQGGKNHPLVSPVALYVLPSSVLSCSSGLQTQSDSVVFLPVKQLGSVMREYA